MGRLDVFLGVRAAVEPMTAEGRGSIVNISSIDGLMGSPWIISYAASKWAAGGMTKAAAMELASRSRAGELGASRSRAHPSRIGTGAGPIEGRGDDRRTHQAVRSDGPDG